MEKKVDYQTFLENIVKALVDNPEAVKIEKTLDEMGVLLTLHIDPKDMGLVVGRQGTTIKAIRTLLRVVGLKNRARINLKLEEPEKKGEEKKSELEDIKL